MIKGILADRSNPYWSMILEAKLREKWTILDAEGNMKVYWRMVFFELNVCGRIPTYDPFYGDNLKEL